MTSESYKKLKPQKEGPVRIIEVQPHTVVLDKGRVANVVSIHSVTAAPQLIKSFSKTVQTQSLPKNKTQVTQRH